jgi:hypothetical protein
MRNMRISGQNFLYALGIACLFVLVFSAILAMIGAVVTANNSPNPAGMEFFGIFANTLYGGLFCWGPGVFIISFALLQRFRVKINNDD